MVQPSSLSRIGAGEATRLINHPALDKELKPFIYALPIEIEILQNQQDKLTNILLTMLEKIQETAAYLKGKMHTSPETAIILGTGLGSLANEITEKYEIKYSDIPNFPVSTVEGHSGKLIFGKLGNLVSLTNQFLAGTLPLLRGLFDERSNFPCTCHA